MRLTFFCHARCYTFHHFLYVYTVSISSYFRQVLALLVSPCRLTLPFPLFFSVNVHCKAFLAIYVALQLRGFVIYILVFLTELNTIEVTKMMKCR